MTKKQGDAAMAWLEELNGGTLPPMPEHIRERWAAEDAAEAEARHLSLRVPRDLYARLEQLANQRSETVSQVARTLIAEGLDHRRSPDHAALDSAIAALQSLRRNLPAPPEAAAEVPKRKKAS